MKYSELDNSLLICLSEQIQDAALIVRDNVIVDANEQLALMTGYDLSELVGQDVFKFVFRDDVEKLKQYREARLKGDTNIPDQYNFRVQTRAGKVIDVRIKVGITLDSQNRKCFLATLRDLAVSESNITSILDNMPDVFYRTDLHGIITLISPSCEGVLGYQPSEMVGQPMAGYYCNPDDREKIIAALKEGKGRAQQVEACLVGKNGEKKWISTNAYVRLDSVGNPVGIEGIARDISDRKAMEERILQMASTDGLTQISNREYFLTEADKLIQIANRYHWPLSVLMMDLDFFKKINDRYGHAAGDRTLQHFVQTCQEVMRESDSIGRLGGEEFAILAAETDIESARQLAERICEKIASSSVELDDVKINYTVSIGVFGSDKIQSDIGHLLSKADRALYQAKKNGRNQVCLNLDESS